MPRKTDGILFELQPRPTKGDDGNPLLYAQPVVDHKYDLDDIDDFCNKYRHTSKGEMKRFFDLLEEVATMWLRQGQRVETPFGSFAPKIILFFDLLEEALRKSVRYGYITIKTFQTFSRLKYKSAQRYLDSLCQGDNPCLGRYKEGRTWHYILLKTAPSV